MTKKEHNHLYYVRHKEYILARNRNWGRLNREKKLAQNTRWRKRHPDAAIALVTGWQKRNREKLRAHWAVKWALENGSLIRQPCEICGNARSHAHHDDYSKPLVVRWLCALHHALYHQMLRELCQENQLKTSTR